MAKEKNVRSRSRDKPIASDVPIERNRHSAVPKSRYKRPMMKGGFVLDSDESETEEYNKHIEYDESSSATTPPLYQQLAMDGRNTETDAVARPMNQVNGTLLNTLLSRKRSAQSLLKRNSRLAPVAQLKMPPLNAAPKQGKVSYSAKGNYGLSTNKDDPSLTVEATKRLDVNNTRTHMRNGRTSASRELSQTESTARNSEAALPDETSSLSSTSPVTPVTTEEQDISAVHQRPSKASCLDAEVISSPTSTAARVSPVVVKTASPHEEQQISSEAAITPQHPNLPVLAADPVDSVENGWAISTLPHFRGISHNAEPCFEYSVFQKTWRCDENEDDVTPIEIISRPYHSVDEANAQAEKLFQNLRSQYTLNLQLCFSEWTGKRNEHDCSTLLGVFSPADYPTKKSFLQIWVQRHFVSKYANQSLTAPNATPLVEKTAYMVRLFKLLPASDESESESESDTDSATNQKAGGARNHPKPMIRAYHALPRPEIYTTLAAANRAARGLEIELSHEADPKDAITKKWQERKLKLLADKLFALDAASMRVAVREGEGGEGEEGGYWISKFNACGRGGDTFELRVERVGVCGPRN